MRQAAAFIALLAASLSADAAPPPRTGCVPANAIVIGHRGASGYRPEHTLAAYKLAIDLGADFIEPDLVSTKDGHLVARHENELSGSTDVASHPEFADRKATKAIDGEKVTGWFSEDFTLAELKTLRARERIPSLRPQNTFFDGRFEIPTLEEVIALAKAEGRPGRVIGLYPETKHPSHFQQIGLPLEEPLVRILHAAGFRERAAPVFIQSFEVGNLKKLRKLTRLRLVQLISEEGLPYDLAASGDPTRASDLLTPDGLRRIAAYADGVGVYKNAVIPRDAEGRLGAPSSLVADAHVRGLLVHVWTFRAENQFLPADLRIGEAAAAGFPMLRGDFAEELRRFWVLGLDGIFADQPDAAVATRTGMPRCQNP